MTISQVLQYTVRIYILGKSTAMHFIQMAIPRFQTERVWVYQRHFPKWALCQQLVLS